MLLTEKSYWKKVIKLQKTNIYIKRLTNLQLYVLRLSRLFILLAKFPATKRKKKTEKCVTNCRKLRRKSFNVFAVSSRCQRLRDKKKKFLRFCMCFFVFVILLFCFCHSFLAEKCVTHSYKKKLIRLRKKIKMHFHFAKFLWPSNGIWMTSGGNFYSK